MRPWPQSDKANTGSRRRESAFAEAIRKPCAPSQSHTQPESLGKPPFRSRRRTGSGRIREGVGKP